MYHWQNEFMAEMHRQQLLAEAKEINLEEIARQGRLYRPGLFERTMFNFANWMIATGKQLRKRYELPVQCNKSASGSYAH